MTSYFEQRIDSRVVDQDKLPILLSLPSYGEFKCEFSLLNPTKRPKQPEQAVLDMKSDQVLVLLKAKKPKRFTIHFNSSSKEKAVFFSYKNSEILPNRDVFPAFAKSRSLKHINPNHIIFLKEEGSSDYFGLTFSDFLARKGFLKLFTERKNRKLFFNKDEIEGVKVGKVLGKGHFGSVHLIEFQQKQFAMKILSLEEKSPLFKFNCNERVILEKIQQRKSKYLQKLQASFVFGNNLILIVDYCSSGTLLEFIKKQKFLSEETALFIFHQIFLGLKAMHDLNIAHRDIKPENIMFTGSGVKLIDFGLSQEIEDKSFEVLGTIYYQSPEMLRGLGHGLTSDYWQMGILFYEMLFGKPLFYNSDTKLVERKIISQGSVLLPTWRNPALSEEAIDFLYSILIREPVDRLGYNNGVEEILKHGLFSNLSNEIPIDLQEHMSSIVNNPIDLEEDMTESLLPFLYKITPASSLKPIKGKYPFNILGLEYLV